MFCVCPLLSLSRNIPAFLKRDSLPTAFWDLLFVSASSFPPFSHTHQPTLLPFIIIGEGEEKDMATYCLFRPHVVELENGIGVSCGEEIEGKQTPIHV